MCPSVYLQIMLKTEFLSAVIASMHSFTGICISRWHRFSGRRRSRPRGGSQRLWDFIFNWRGQTLLSAVSAITSTIVIIVVVVIIVVDDVGACWHLLRRRGTCEWRWVLPWRRRARLSRSRAGCTSELPQPLRVKIQLWFQWKWLIWCATFPRYVRYRRWSFRGWWKTCMGWRNPTGCHRSRGSSQI